MTTKGRPSGDTPHVFVPDGSMDVWYQAKALAGQQPCWMTVFGTSISTGQGSTDWNKYGCTEVMRAALTTSGAAPLYADLWTPYPFSPQVSFQGTPPFVFNQAPTIQTYGYNKTPFWGNTAVPLLTFTSPYAATSFDLLYLDYAAGTFTVTIDGGAPQTITTTGPGTQAGAICKRATYSGLTNTAHTIVIGSQSATNVANPMGIILYANPVGIGFCRLSYPTAKCIDFQNSSGAPNDRCILFQGTMPQGAAPTSPTGFGIPTQPHLAIIEFGINDETSQVGIDTYRGTMRRLIQALRRGRDGCSIIILGACLPDGVNSDVTGGGVQSDYWRYLDAMHTLARSYNCAFVDIHSRWGELGLAKGLEIVSDIHPTNLGHADMASVLLSII